MERESNTPACPQEVNCFPMATVVYHLSITQLCGSNTQPWACRKLSTSSTSLLENRTAQEGMGQLGDQFILARTACQLP